MKFTKDSINIEPAKVFSEISSKLKEDVTKNLESEELL